MDKVTIKRVADILEKFGVGSMLVGLYQQNWIAIILGCGFMNVYP